VSRFPAARFLKSAATPAQFPADSGVEIAFAGRSNAGKSSAINALTARRALARVSKTPGRTRLLNFFELAPGRRLVDLPGYGYAAGPEVDRINWAALIEALRKRRSLAGLMLIVDARRGLRPEDMALVHWAEGLPVHVLLSKVDKLSRREASDALRSATAALGERAGVQLFSSVTHEGIDAARRVIEAWIAGERGIKNPGDLGEVTGGD